MRPMLATQGPSSPAGSGVPRGDGWAHEIKWDGIRLIARVRSGSLRLTTRSEREITVAFPELAGLASLGHDLVLDGEAVSFVDGVPSFSHLVERVHTTSAAKARLLAASRPTTYLAFDLVGLDGLDLSPLPWSARRAALEDILPDRARWHTQRLGALREKGTPGLFGETIAQTARATVLNAERRDLEFGALQKDTRLDVDEGNPHRRSGAPQDDAEHQIVDPVQRTPGTVDLQTLDGLPPREGRDQSPQPQDVIQMAMGEQHTVETAEAQAAPQDLALRPLATVDEKALVAMQHHLCRQPPLDRGGRGCGAQEYQFKH